MSPTARMMVADATACQGRTPGGAQDRPQGFAVEDAGEPVLHAPAGLDVAQGRVEAQVLGHPLVRVEHTSARPAVRARLLGEARAAPGPGRAPAARAAPRRSRRAAPAAARAGRARPTTLAGLVRHPHRSGGDQRRVVGRHRRRLAADALDVAGVGRPDAGRDRGGVVGQRRADRGHRRAIVSLGALSCPGRNLTAANGGQHATRNDRPGPDGRQPHPPADARRARDGGVEPGSRRRSRRSRPRAPSAPRRPPTWSRSSSGPGRSGSWCRRRVTGQVVSDVAALLDAGDTIIDGGNSYYRDDIAPGRRARAAGHPLRRRRHVRRRVRARSRLLPDDRRRGRGRRPARADLRHASPPASTRPPRTPGRDGRRRPRPSTGYLHCGPERRRALREDGAQRHRVRHHGRLRRGPRHPASNADVGLREQARRRRDGAARPPRVLPLRDRHGRGGRGVAARQRRRLVAARPDGHGAARVARPGGVLRPRVRLRRGPVDVDRRDRGGHPRLRAHGGRVRAVQLARRGHATPTSVLSAMRKQFGGHVELPAGGD